ncbi:hypothetical protein [Antarctobacter sp.]|uniref:hypothetical protein n=1 Tax=Antarctobacter sp. TaxID=1872577 RepID=UPI002B272F1B|nr:hypothetical protein [Antarctobacter sp.]
MTVKARFLQAPLVGACVLALGLTALPLRAETHATVDDPVAERADLIEVATTLDAQLSVILDDLDAEIALQEENAGFGASAETLAQIDGLIARRAEMAAKRAEVRALLAVLRGDP